MRKETRKPAFCWLLLILVLLLVGCSRPRWVRGNILLIPSRDDIPTPDLFAVNWDPTADETTFHATYVTGPQRKVLWEQAFDEFDSWYFLQSAYGNEAIYYAAGDRLLALSRDDGATLWEGNLSDVVWSHCPACMGHVGDRVFVLTADYVLQSFDQAGEGEAWSLRLNHVRASYEGFRVFGDDVVVVDRTAPDGSTWAVQIVDAANGYVARTLAPACPQADERPYFDPDQLFFEGGGGQNRAIFLYECRHTGYVQSRDLSTGAVVWEASLPEEVNTSYDSAIVGRDDLYLLSGEELFAISLSDGSMQELPVSDPDYDLVLLEEWGDELLAWARRTRGSTHYELWGLSPAGEHLWSYDLTSSYEPATPTDLSDWAYRFTVDGLLLIEVKEEPERISALLLDPKTGEVLNQTVLELDYASLDGLAWGRDAAYVTSNGTVYAVDLETLEISKVWP